QLTAVAPDAWATLRFAVSPSLLLLDCAWPVQRVRERFEAEDGAAADEVPALAAEPTVLRVWRCDERVRYAGISGLERDALTGLRAGDSFAALCERVSAVVGERDAAAHAA